MLNIQPSLDGFLGSLFTFLSSLLNGIFGFLSGFFDSFNATIG